MSHAVSAVSVPDLIVDSINNLVSDLCDNRAQAVAVKTILEHISSDNDLADALKLFEAAMKLKGQTDGTIRSNKSHLKKCLSTYKDFTAKEFVLYHPSNSLQLLAKAVRQFEKDGVVGGPEEAEGDESEGGSEEGGVEGDAGESTPVDPADYLKAELLRLRDFAAKHGIDFDLLVATGAACKVLA